MNKIVLLYYSLLRHVARVAATTFLASSPLLAQAADMRTVESFFIQFAQTKDEVMLALAMKRCAALHLLIATKMEQANQPDGATFNM